MRLEIWRYTLFGGFPGFHTDGWRSRYGFSPGTLEFFWSTWILFEHEGCALYSIPDHRTYKDGNCVLECSRFHAHFLPCFEYIYLSLIHCMLGTVDREIFARKNIHLLNFYSRRLGIPEV